MAGRTTVLSGATAYTAILVGVLMAAASPLAAQSANACTSQDCLVFNQIWLPAGQLHELKNQFVTAVRLFVEAISSRYGDEATQIDASLPDIEQSLSRWDDGIRFYEGILSRLEETAEVRIGLGTVYLDRARADDALREFERASRLEARRADAHSLSALAYAASNKPQEAARSLRAAAALDSANLITLYGLAQALTKSGDPGGATEAYRAFITAAQATQRGVNSLAGPAAPFERVSLFRQVAGVAPIFPPQLYRRGFELLAAGRFAEAIAEFKRALATDPLKVSTTGTNLIAEAATALRQGGLEAALPRLEEAVEAAPQRVDARRALGVAYWADEQFDKAVAQLEHAVRLAPEDERGHLALADLLTDAGRSNEAERVLKAALARFPDSGQAHYRLGRLLQAGSLIEDAIREFEAASKLEPLTGRDRLYETLGELYANQANLDGAADAYSRRIDANPNNAQAHRRIGEIYFLQGRDEEALAEFLTTRLLEPNSAEARAAAAQVYVRLGQYDAAVEAARQALTRNEHLKEAHYALAMSLLRLGQPEEAARELEVFQRLQVEAMAHNQRLSTLKIILRDAAQKATAGDYAAAVTLYRDALDIDPDAVDVYRDLSLALRKSGRFEEAIAPLQKASQLEDRADVHELLAEVYRLAGRLEASQAESRQATAAVARRKLARLRKAAGVE